MTHLVVATDATHETPARSKDCDLSVMAWHGRHGMSAIVLSSETVKVPPMSCL